MTQQLTTAKPTSAEQTAPRTYTYPTGTELMGTTRNSPTGRAGRRPRLSIHANDRRPHILGAPQLTFYVSLQHEDADFVVDLHDLYPNGDIQYVQRGLMRASMRAIDGTRTRPDAIRQRYAAREPLMPGRCTRSRCRCRQSVR